MTVSQTISTNPEPREYLPPHELAALTGVPTGTLAQWRYRGVGPTFIKAGRRVLYSRRAVEEWLEANTRTQTGGAA